MNQSGFVQNRQHSEKVEKIHKDDLACYGHDVDEMNFANSGSIFKEFNDELLDKISQKGYHFLSDEEKEFLKRASKEG
mgnify:CR=1 FL=1